jgi:hypothetical protein
MSENDDWFDETPKQEAPPPEIKKRKKPGPQPRKKKVRKPNPLRALTDRLKKVQRVIEEEENKHPGKLAGLHPASRNYPNVEKSCHKTRKSSDSNLEKNHPTNRKLDKVVLSELAEFRRLRREEDRWAMLPPLRVDGKIVPGSRSLKCPECGEIKLRLSQWAEDNGRLICRKCLLKKNKPQNPPTKVVPIFHDPIMTWEFEWDYLDSLREAAGISLARMAKVMEISHVTYIRRRDTERVGRLTVDVALRVLDELEAVNVTTGDHLV